MTKPATEPEVPELDPISHEEGYDDVNEREEVTPLLYGITSFGADFPVDSLVKRMDNHDIVVPTFDPDVSDTDSNIVGFQRDFVWTKPQCDRFIESFYWDSLCQESFWFRDPRVSTWSSMVSNA